MFNGLRRTSEPVLEPVLLADAKKYLRIDHSDEDAQLEAMIIAAREQCEEITKRAFLQQTWTLTAAEISLYGESLPRPPIISVDSVEYRDTDGAWQPFTSYHVDLLEEPARLTLTESAPSTANLPDAWRIIYKAGFGSAPDDVPKSIHNAILLKLKALYEKEEDSNHLHTAAETILQRHVMPFQV